MAHKLSNKRREHARRVGEAYAHGAMKDYAEGGINTFLQGLKGLPQLIAGMAEVGLFTSCTWEPTEEEKQIAHDRCKEVLELAYAVALKYVEHEVKGRLDE